MVSVRGEKRVKTNEMGAGKEYGERDLDKVFVIQSFMEIWYINLRKSLEIQTSLIFSNV